MKEYEINNASIEKMVEELVKNRTKILDDFAKAYLAETKLLPSEVELVNEQRNEDNKIVEVYYFRKKVKNG